VLPSVDRRRTQRVDAHRLRRRGGCCRCKDCDVKKATRLLTAAAGGPSLDVQAIAFGIGGQKRTAGNWPTAVSVTSGMLSESRPPPVPAAVGSSTRSSPLHGTRYLGVVAAVAWFSPV
jgi:hypothetical protein